MNILWLSRHEPTQKQKAELRKIFGKKVKTHQVAATISKGEEVQALMRLHNCREVVTVLPITLLEQVTTLGVKPIRAVMERRFDAKGNVQFHFSHFERVEHVEVAAERL